MTGTSSWLNPRSSSSMLAEMVWENDIEIVKRRRMCDDDDHDLHNLMSGSKDSHVVPDEDDFKFDDDHHQHHHQVAPKVTKTAHLFDLNRDLKDDLNDDKALAAIMMINDDINEDVVVPHDSPLPAPKHPPPNEAEPPALVPSLSVCSNHLPCDQGAQEGQSEPPPKRSPKRKRGAKMEKKLRALQGLIPNCNHKVDSASILDEAIVYVKTLQLQLQMMSMPFPMMGIPPFVAPPLILPHRHHHPFPAFPNFHVNSI